MKAWVSRLTSAKTIILEQLASRNDLTVITLQETHAESWHRDICPQRFALGSCRTIPQYLQTTPSRLAPSTLPDVPAPAVYTGNLNSHHTNWGYSNFNTDGDSLVDWASTVYATLLYDPKELLFLLCTLEQLH